MNDKPKYNMWQTTCFLFRCTWNYRRSLFALAATYVCVHIFRRLLELYIAPTIVGRLEARVPLLSLIGTILAFTISIVVTSWVSSFARRFAQTENNRCDQSESLQNLVSGNPGSQNDQVAGKCHVPFE